MRPSLERLLALAATTGFRSETLEKVIRLGDIVADIRRHPILSRSLALKGGTALNLGFGEPRRLSVDLDFNYIASVERDRMLADRPEVERALGAVAEGQGYRVQRSAEEHAGRKMFLSYPNAHGSPDRIEIDVNFLFRLPLRGVSEVVLWQPGELERPTVTVVGLEELSAGKVCALLVRAAPRDLFDVGRLPEVASTIWATTAFRRLFIGFAGILDHPVYGYERERLGRITDRAVVQELHPMLIQEERPTAAELQVRAWEAVASLIALDEAEREYTDRLQRGELRPELLFPEEHELAERLRRNPALAWKARNARMHATRGG